MPQQYQQQQQNINMNMSSSMMNNQSIPMMMNLYDGVNNVNKEFSKVLTTYIGD